MEENLTLEKAILGDSDVFIKRTAGGFIKAVKGFVNLTEKDGHLIKEDDETSVTAAGLNYMNRIANISVIFPDTLILPDGKKAGNPYVEYDSLTRSITKVWCKKYAVGYSPTGNLVITGSLVIFDIRMYFLHDLTTLISKDKDAGRLCDKNNVTEAEKNANTTFFPLMSTLGVLANNNNIDVIQAERKLSMHIKYAERIAQTLAERNCLKKHPTLSMPVKIEGSDGNHFARVEVIGFTSDLSEQEIEKIKAALEENKRIVIDGTKINTEETTDTIDDNLQNINAILHDSKDNEKELKNSKPQQQQQFQMTLI